MMWHVVSLAVFAGLVAFALDRWFSHRRRQLEQAELIHQESWKSVKTSTGRAWQCPGCAVRLESWAQVRAHSDPDSCACAAFRAAQYEARGADPVPLLVEVIGSRATLDTFTEESDSADFQQQ